jgi:hypothetical protein
MTDTVRDLVGELTEGWKKSEKGYTLQIGGEHATLAKGKNKKWYLHFKGKIIQMPKKASFDHAEGMIKSMM